MVLFFPIQQELDCIRSNGQILGKIKYDVSDEKYVFAPESDTTVLSGTEEALIVARLAGLMSGIYSMQMQDDD